MGAADSGGILPRVLNELALKNVLEQHITLSRVLNARLSRDGARDLRHLRLLANVMLLLGGASDGMTLGCLRLLGVATRCCRWTLRACKRLGCADLLLLGGVLVGDGLLATSLEIAALNVSGGLVHRVLLVEHVLGLRRVLTNFMISGIVWHLLAAHLILELRAVGLAEPSHAAVTSGGSVAAVLLVLVRLA